MATNKPKDEGSIMADQFFQKHHGLKFSAFSIYN